VRPAVTLRGDALESADVVRRTLLGRSAARDAEAARGVASSAVSDSAAPRPLALAPALVLSHDVPDAIALATQRRSASTLSPSENHAALAAKATSATTSTYSTALPPLLSP